MPLPTIDAFEGEDIRELVDALEKQRKELAYILSSLDTANVNGFNAKVINAGVINGKHIHINSDTTFEDGYDPEGLRTEINTQFNVIDGQIQSKVSTETFNLLGARVSTAEASVTTMAGQIALKAESSTVSALGTRVNTAEININGLNGSITSKVSYTDYTGERLVSMINQTPSYIEINAQKINLVGAVTVLSDISGNLGTITAGYINISTDISVGNNIYLGSQNSTSTKRINFNNNTSISGGGGVTGYLALSAETLDLRDVYEVINAPMLVQSPNRTRIGLRYSSTSRRVYVDINGSEVGFLSLQ